MWDLVEKYWDLIIGFIVGLGLSVMAHSNSETVRMLYSVIILVLACMGLFRFIRQSIDKRRAKHRANREHNLLDGMVDNLITVKAISLAQEPTKVGENAGKLFIKILEVKKDIMKGLKQFFDKYKGYLLTIVLGVLTVVEHYGGYINEICKGSLTVKGVEVLPIVTLVCTILVGILSNGYTKEQKEKIKALFSRSSTNELVHAEIKKKLKENSNKLSQFNKILSTKETELENLKSELEGLENSYNAKGEMYTMTPQLATEEDVKLALNAVMDCRVKIDNKTAEIEEYKATVSNLATTISALKSQL